MSSYLAKVVELLDAGFPVNMAGQEYVLLDKLYTRRTVLASESGENTTVEDRVYDAEYLSISGLSRLVGKLSDSEKVSIAEICNLKSDEIKAKVSVQERIDLISEQFNQLLGQEFNAKKAINKDTGKLEDVSGKRLKLMRTIIHNSPMTYKVSCSDIFNQGAAIGDIGSVWEMMDENFNEYEVDGPVASDTGSLNIPDYLTPVENKAVNKEEKPAEIKPPTPMMI